MTVGKESIIQARGLTCVFGTGRKKFVAVDHVDFDIYKEEIISIVGESGSGKTTLARMLLMLQESTVGTLLFGGKPVENKRDHWRRVQAVFQDPYASFNQFYSVESQMKACFNLFRENFPEPEKRKRIDAALKSVGLEPAEVKEKFPFELSGGQMQRLLIARIFLIRPTILIADEPTSMIDACLRASILDLLLDLKKELKMCIIFITHDIGLSHYVSDRIFVMCKGKIVETGHPDDVISRPQHEYTKKLLEDIPVLNKMWLKEE
jgi:peptide/nickel transport system ATP-binding protein